MTIVLSSLHPSMKSLFLRTQPQRQRFCTSVLWIRMRKTNSSTPCRAASTRWVSRSFVWILQLALFTLWRHWITKPFTSTSSRSWYGSRPLLRPTLQFLKGFMHLGGVLSQENSNGVDHNVDFFFQVRDQDVPVKRNFARIVVNVSDTNDHAPWFTSSSYEGRVYESSAVGSAVLQVTALDKDKGRNAEVVYSIESGTWRALQRLITLHSLKSLFLGVKTCLCITAKIAYMELTC